MVSVFYIPPLHPKIYIYLFLYIFCPGSVLQTSFGLMMLMMKNVVARLTKFYQRKPIMHLKLFSNLCLLVFMNDVTKLKQLGVQFLRHNLCYKFVHQKKKSCTKHALRLDKSACNQQHVVAFLDNKNIYKHAFHLHNSCLSRNKTIAECFS